MPSDSPTSLTVGQIILKVILSLKPSSLAFPSIREEPSSFCLKQSSLCSPRLSPEADPCPTQGRGKEVGEIHTEEIFISDITKMVGAG